MKAQIIFMTLSLISLSALSEAQTADLATSPQPTRIAQTPPHLRVYVDPITQELRSEPVTAGQAARANALILAAPNYNLMQAETLPDGSRVLHTNGQVKMTTIGHVNADGTTQEICIPTGSKVPAISTPSLEQKP